MTNSERVRRWFEEVWNNDNDAAIEEMMAPEMEGHGLAPEPLRGPEGFRTFYHPFRNAFDYVRVEIDHTLESGDEVAFRGRARMSPKGDPNTYEISGCGFLRYRDGKMISGYNTWDFLSLMVQMGAVPADVASRALAASATRGAGS